MWKRWILIVKQGANTMTTNVTQNNTKRQYSPGGTTRLYVSIVLLSFVLLHILAIGGGGIGPILAEARPRLSLHRKSSASWSAKSPRDGSSAEEAASNKLRENRCVSQSDYEACYMCGKIVDNRDIYFDCCAGERAVLEFCEQLLFWLLIVCRLYLMIEISRSIMHDDIYFPHALTRILL